MKGRKPVKNCEISRRTTADTTKGRSIEGLSTDGKKRTDGYEGNEDISDPGKVARLTKLKRLCDCDRILSESEIGDFGQIKKYDETLVNDALESEDCNEDLQAEYLKISRVLDIPNDTYSITKIEAHIPPCLKYEFRTGLTHMNMQKFSPLTRGYQASKSVYFPVSIDYDKINYLPDNKGPAVAVAAIATSRLIKPQCWNEFIVDRVIEDGDTYYAESYKKIQTDDRRTVTLLDLKRNLYVRDTHCVTVNIDDPIYVGTFRSETPVDLHVAKALELFFNKYNNCVLTSSVLNIAIWKQSNLLNVFDGQARLENCEIDSSKDNGSAKLFMLRHLSEVLSIILEKSHVENESFILYNIKIVDVKKISELPEVDEDSLVKPRPSTDDYRVHEKYRAVVRGTYHLKDDVLPEEFRGRGHLTIAVAALVYSKLLKPSKWSKVMIDLIFNQANVYLTDLVRVLGIRFNESFKMSINDLLCDVILGVYTAKIKVQESVIPDRESKIKIDIATGFRDYFANRSTGILELNNVFYAIWKDNDKYYFLDPFACDCDGFRVDFSDTEESEKLKTAAACVTMNSSINQLLETVLTNTETSDKDPFTIHGVSILYVKTGSDKDGAEEKVVFRERKTNRRPTVHPTPLLPTINDCMTIADTIPVPRVENTEKNSMVQYPETMDQVELFVDTIDECKDVMIETNLNNSPSGYKVVNPSRLMLNGTTNCVVGNYKKLTRGKQGLLMALTMLTHAENNDITNWTSEYVDKIIADGHFTYERILTWLRLGSPENFFSNDGENESYFEDNNSVTTIPHNLYDLDLTMLPEKFTIGDDDLHIYLSWKMNVIEGKANPLSNLGEALEQYFHRFDKMILENKRLMYSIWKSNGKYCIFNPYGNDNDGWRSIIEPATLFVVSNIIELVNLLYGLLEFNDFHFIFHFVKITLQNDMENFEENLPDFQKFEKYQTKYLPIVNNDFNDNSPACKIQENSIDSDNNGIATINTDTINGEEYETSDEIVANLNFIKEKESVNVFKLSEETDQKDTPTRLNLALVTGIIKIESIEKANPDEKNIELSYEKLKYRHPPPFVTPPKKNVCNLMDAKLASNSMHSLLSRFSIDSKLALKEKNDLPTEREVTITLFDSPDRPKLITLSTDKYFFSKTLDNGLTPIRAINERFIRNKKIDRELEEDCKKKKTEKEKILVPEDTPESTNCCLPNIIPLGPCIQTPKYEHTDHECPEIMSSICLLTDVEKEDQVLNKLACSTENLLFELMIPGFGEKIEKNLCDEVLDSNCGCSIGEEYCKEVKCVEPEPCGFKETDDENIGIIQANSSLEDRYVSNMSHYKSCYISAIICILIKINLNITEIKSSILDNFIAAAEKITDGIGQLRYKRRRCFRNLCILGLKCNVILKQERYADPENYEPDVLDKMLKLFLKNHQTGIIVFSNVSYAFWLSNGMYYLFDSYPCNENGLAAPVGSACLMQICDFDAFYERILRNTGSMVRKPYRLYTVLIAHLESLKETKPERETVKSRKGCCSDCCEKSQAETEVVVCPVVESEPSLIELSEWVCKTKMEMTFCDTIAPGFVPVKNYKASCLEMAILDDEITMPILPPVIHKRNGEMIREQLSDRKFYEQTVIEEPVDVCLMAWSQIYEPTLWSPRTLRALFDASVEYAFDSLLASEDSTVEKMTDNLLKEFNIANFSFRVVFAPLHCGTLYSTIGWNLAMSLEKIFESPVYNGGIIVCGNTHIGVMKKADRLYAWWLVKWTKNIRIIVSEDMQDYLKLIVQEINEPEEINFSIRMVTISYAKMFGPSCSDLDGLHETMMPSTSVPEIHTKETENYNLCDVFRSIKKCRSPTYIRGSVAFSDRDVVTEPYTKRCYFAALLAVALKRDVVQNPLPGMIDKVLELADILYKSFHKPKYHTQHILKDVNFMNRAFDFRDCASNLVKLQVDNDNNVHFFVTVKKELKKFFKNYTSGILHFSNCCYGFWYAKAINRYIYLDPYPCNEDGSRACESGYSCLCIFSTIDDMVKRMRCNRYEKTTGFYIHRIHLESVSASSAVEFQEDPVWLYLDCHWSYSHIVQRKTLRNARGKKRSVVETKNRWLWKNYTIEVPDMIYSIWGSLGTFDERFGSCAGKNQLAIAIVSFAVQYLCHPSEWKTNIIDSIVLQGDKFHKKSKKSSAACLNRFRLLDRLEVSPYIWTVNLGFDICGVVYGDPTLPNLVKSLERGLNKSSKLLLQCGQKVLAITKDSDAFYVLDSSWTGPPLFATNHGAAYVVRCKNLRVLVYVVTKALNSNWRLEFKVTPVNITFDQETCRTSTIEPKLDRRVFLDKPAYPRPGRTVNHSCLVNGDVVVPEEDSYLCYSRNLKLGLMQGKEFEEATLDKPMKIEEEKRTVSSSSIKILDTEVKYPVIVDLMRDVKIPKPTSEAVPKCVPTSCGTCLPPPERKPTECREDASFILEETREIYDRYNDAMKKEYYANYNHCKANDLREEAEHWESIGEDADDEDELDDSVIFGHSDVE